MYYHPFHFSIASQDPDDPRLPRRLSFPPLSAPPGSPSATPELQSMGVTNPPYGIQPQAVLAHQILEAHAQALVTQRSGPQPTGRMRPIQNNTAALQFGNVEPPDEPSRTIYVTMALAADTVTEIFQYLSPEGEARLTGQVSHLFALTNLHHRAPDMEYGSQEHDQAVPCALRTMAQNILRSRAYRLQVNQEDRITPPTEEPDVMHQGAQQERRGNGQSAAPLVQQPAVPPGIQHPAQQPAAPALTSASQYQPAVQTTSTASVQQSVTSASTSASPAAILDVSAVLDSQPDGHTVIEQTNPVLPDPGKVVISGQEYFPQHDFDTIELSHYVTIDVYNQVHRLTPRELVMLQYHSADRYRHGSYQAATGSSSSMALAGVRQPIVYPPPPPDESRHQSGDSGASTAAARAKAGQHQYELVSPCHGQVQRQYGRQGYQCRDSQHCLDQG